MKQTICVLLVLLTGLLPQTGWAQFGPQLPQPTKPTFAERVLAVLNRQLQDSFIQPSFDYVNQHYKGPSYLRDPRNVPTVFAINLAIYIKKGQSSPNQGASNGVINYYGDRQAYARPLDPALLLVTTDNRPGPMAPAPDPKDAFMSHLSFIYGLQLIGKGGKYNDGYGTSTTHITYLEIPTYVLYEYDLPNQKGQLFGGLGVYLGVGLWGTVNYTDKTTNESFGAFSDNGGLSRFDGGLNFMAGYQLPQGLRLSVVHEFGLANIQSGGGADKTFNRVWSLNVGYPLKKITDKLRKK